MVGSLVLVERPWDGVARLRLNRPEKRNALSIALRDQMSDALDTLADDTAVKTVVITGAGDVFSAGFDLREFEDTDPDHQAALWTSSERWHVTLLRFPLPLVAAVNGPALAGGFDLATMCDIRVAADVARFAHPEYSWGPVVYAPLEVAVGGSVARELAFTGRELSAQEALDVHLVSRVVPPDELEAAAGELCGRIAAAERSALVDNKRRMAARANTVTPDGRLNV
ncbi:MAG TPA: enoyl-CoA hydratase/isomerase family protein [Acidimicrobiales bacterium]|jgi:enoyl-CoA hydratase